MKNRAFGARTRPRGCWQKKPAVCRFQGRVAELAAGFALVEYDELVDAEDSDERLREWFPVPGEHQDAAALPAGRAMHAADGYQLRPRPPPEVRRDACMGSVYCSTSGMSAWGHPLQRIMCWWMLNVGVLPRRALVNLRSGGGGRLSRPVPAFEAPCSAPSLNQGPALPSPLLYDRNREA
jgi:hypothetical protein